MIKKHHLFLFAFVAFFFSCNDEKTPTTKALQETKEIEKNIAENTQQDTNISPEKYVRMEESNDTNAISVANKNKKFIYFTIDDGPSAYSDDILNMAKDKNVKMTVFLIGRNMETKAFNDEFTAYRDNRLIEICNHSYSHANNRYESFYRNPNGVLSDFYKNIVKLNLTNSIARFPGSPAWMVNGRQKNVQTTRKAAATLLKDKGFRIFGWDSEWEFSYRNGAPKGKAENVLEDIETRIRTNDTFVKNHCVLLLHERMFQNKTEIARLVTLLQQKGFVFEHLRNYPKI